MITQLSKNTALIYLAKTIVVKIDIVPYYKVFS